MSHVAACVARLTFVLLAVVQPRLVYTDRPDSDKYTFARCFGDSMGSGFVKGDSGVRGDVMHLIKLHGDSLASGHPKAQAAVQDLAASLKVCQLHLAQPTAQPSSQFDLSNSTT